jgi:CBS domain-containing protein
MNAADIMTRAVVSVDPDLPLVEVAKLMLGRGISAVCVVERDGRLVGMVSEGDLLHRAEIKTETRPSWWLRVIAGDDELAADYAKCRGRKARDVMSRSLVTVGEDAPAAAIVALLDKHRIKRVPVLRDGRVVGIVSRADLLRAFASESSRERPELAETDEAIRARMLSELRKQVWWHGRDEEVVVANGTVHLWGSVRSADEKHALAIAAENTPGVKAVRNHVTISAPVTLYDA